MSQVEVGQMAPDFVANDENGNEVSLSKLKGQKVVLFFYPKDDSPSCTKEACSIRDNYPKLNKHNVVIYGVSPDNEKKHKKFIDKYEFPYSLLADPDKDIIKKYGFWGEKKFMGKMITGVYRTTVIIDEEGRISHIIDDVKTSQHGEQILEVLQQRDQQAS